MKRISGLGQTSQSPEVVWIQDRARLGAPAAYTPGVSANAARVLVAEDDPGISSLVAQIVRRAGYEVDIVGDGDEALLRLEEHSYAAMILDLMMPKRSGLDVIEHLERTAPDTLRSCVIVLTAAAGPVLNTLADKPIYRIITKPFELADLTDALRDCTSAK